MAPLGGGTWTMAGSCPDSCDGPAVRLRDGRVLVEGDGTILVPPYILGEPSYGGVFNPAISASADVFDPSSNRWTRTARMSAPRGDHTATLLPDGRVLVAGGRVSVESPGVTASAEIYDPSTGRWSPTGSMHEPRFDFASVLLPSGNVLVTGGDVDKDDPSAEVSDGSAELYDPATGRWTPTGPMHAGLVHNTLWPLRTGKVLAVGMTTRA